MLPDTGLKLSPDKTSIGIICGQDEPKPDTAKGSASGQMKPQEDIKGLQTFVGLARYM